MCADQQHVWHLYKYLFGASEKAWQQDASKARDCCSRLHTNK
jgi:hypothetical protein